MLHKTLITKRKKKKKTEEIIYNTCDKIFNIYLLFSNKK